MMSNQSPNYRLRLAKGALRNMLAELIQRLQHIRPLEEYQYIGFGSEYYPDFRLFHERFNIREMECIERSGKKRKRMEYNQPYDCINLHFQRSDDALTSSGIDLTKPTIAWLDYESSLREYMLKTDIPQFFNNAPPGSLFFITLNCHGDNPSEATSETVFEKYHKQIGEDYIPTGLRQTPVLMTEPHEIYKRTVDNTIRNKILSDRTYGEEVLRYIQLVNFIYSETTRIMTLGGIILSEEIEEAFEDSNLQDLEFHRQGDDFLIIPSLDLTPGEEWGLKQIMPGVIESDLESADLDYLPADDVGNYDMFYRYYPTFRKTST